MHKKVDTNQLREIAEALQNMARGFKSENAKAVNEAADEIDFLQGELEKYQTLFSKVGEVAVEYGLAGVEGWHGEWAAKVGGLSYGKKDTFLDALVMLVKTETGVEIEFEKGGEDHDEAAD